MARKLGNMDLTHPHFNPNQKSTGFGEHDSLGDGREKAVGWGGPEMKLPLKPRKVSGGSSEN